MNTVSIDELLDIGIALSKEKDGDKLLETILTAAMDITSCDGGTLYIRANDSLHFKIMITKSLNMWQGGDHGEITLPPVALSKENVCACAVLSRQLINIANVYENGGYDFSGPREYDSLTGYQTTSMMVVPMEDDHGVIIGVLQLINALDESGQTIAFAKEYEHVISSLASQAAICLTKMNYAAEIHELFNSFVRVISSGIDARSPYNASHTRNMVKNAARFVDWLNATGNEWHFTEAEKRQLIMSIWLHDIGKLVIPLEVMEKASRLGSKLKTVLHRFEVIGLLSKIEYVSGEISKDEFERRKTDLQEVHQLVIENNRVGPLPPGTQEKVAAFAKKTYVAEDGEIKPWLTEEEREALSIVKGTLTPKEREIMEGHVVMTSKMLSEIKFSKEYAEVPIWAEEHHEFLDGEGYPQGLVGNEIPKEVRLLTILDIFDALTASDRPYRRACSVEQAFEILEDMVNEGKLDGEIVRQFHVSGAWKGDTDETIM